MGHIDAFNVTDATYKTVGDHDIQLSVLTLKDQSPGRYPVMVRFHGGFLLTGARGFEEWMPPWILNFAQSHSAILINPDYRLLPESRGIDILSDVASLFNWLHTSLPFLLSSLGLEADLTRILVSGESAGGYLAAQAAMLHADKGIRAAIVQYGVLDVKTRFFTEAYDKGLLGAPMVPREILDKHVQAWKEGRTEKVVSAALPPARLELVLSVIQHGRYLELLGEESECYVMENLERVKKGNLPPMWLLHGKQDNAVPYEGTVMFAEKMKTLHPDTDLLMTLEDGPHGLDNTPVTLDTPYIKKGTEFIEKYWLGSLPRI